MNACTPILLAEDDENDILFMQMAVKRAGMANPLIVVRDGQEAVDYLSGQGSYGDRKRYPSPGLVLLDLNMPVLTGFNVLEWLQRQPLAREVTVVVLTSSSNPADIQKAMALGAAEYLLKPTNAAQLVPMLRELQARWLAPSPSPGQLSATRPSTCAPNGVSRAA